MKWLIVLMVLNWLFAILNVVVGNYGVAAVNTAVGMYMLYMRSILK